MQRFYDSTVSVVSTGGVPRLPTGAPKAVCTLYAQLASTTEPKEKNSEEVTTHTCSISDQCKIYDSRAEYDLLHS